VRSLFRLVTRYPLTFLIALVLVAVFAVESYQVSWQDFTVGGGLITPTLALRASVYPPSIEHGEWWRLITAGFVHFNVLHIGLNLIGLIFAGVFVEPRFGRFRFAIIYVAALIGGNMLAYLTTIGTREFTGGASGAIMGLFGAILVFATRFWSQREQGGYAAAAVIATLLNGFVNPGVSNAAHIGGLLSGVAVAVVVGLRPGLTQAIRAAEAEAVRRAELARASAPAEVSDLIASDPLNRLELKRSPLAKVAFAGLGVVLILGAWFVLRESYWWSGALLIVGAFAINGTRQKLVLDPRGFHATGLPWGRGLVRWRDVDRFFVTTVRGAKVVGILYNPAYVADTDQRRGLFGKLNVGSVGQAPSFGSADRQAALMEEWRARWS
jgi:membrane associated rhomboid family serine protease